MRIAIITEYFPPTEECEIHGGVELRAFHAAGHLAKNNDVTVFTSMTSDTESGKGSGFKVVSVKPKRAYSQSGSLLQRLRFIKNCVSEVRKRKFDIVDGYNFVSYPVAWRASRKMSSKAIATYHDVWLGAWIKNIGASGVFGEILERYTLSRDWDKFIAVSEYTREKLLNAGANPDKIMVVHNGIDAEEVKNIRAKKSTVPSISCVSRLVRYKRVGDLIRALPIVKEEIPDVMLEIVGTGPEEKNLRRLVKGLELDDNVRFHGFVKKHSDVLEIVKSSHVFCLPSIIEGFGISAIEAMALGVPCLVSDIPPLSEVTKDIRGSLLFNPGDVSDLAVKLLSLLGRKPKLDTEFVLRKYDWDMLAKKMENIYSEIVEK